MALSALERQINDGGLSEWQENVQLHDAVAQIADGTPSEIRSHDAVLDAYVGRGAE